MQPVLRYLVVGGAGFIGSHLVRTLLADEPNARVTIYDNFSSGRQWHLAGIDAGDRLRIVKGEIKDLDGLIQAMQGADCVYHFASNPDISKAVRQPDIDFWEGTYLTNNVLEAMRRTGTRKLLYASGSGVYGDTGLTEVTEDFSPLAPISTYGASKLACEALLSAYAYMFEIETAAFRFANVVGPHQTHGVGYDFVRRLLREPQVLPILGNGLQSKSYIYVEDVLRAMRLVQKQTLPAFSVFNVATLDCLTVNEIADLACGALGLKEVVRQYSGGDRGWRGDVPIVRLNSDRIRRLGWQNQYTAREAMGLAIKSIHSDALAKRFEQA